MADLSTIDLLYALQLPPEKAIAYFRQKGFAIGWSWRDVWQEAHAKAFTVAGVMKMDVLVDIRQAVDKALASGQSYSDFEKELIPVLQRRGWWGRDAQTNKETGEVLGKGLSPWRLKTIYQNNLQPAYMAGRWKFFVDNQANRPYLEYVAIMDKRTRPAHAALNGLVFRIDDPFWQSFYPPNGYGCRCRARSRSDDDVTSNNLNVGNSTGRLSVTQVPTSSKEGAPLVDVTRYEYQLGKYVAPDPGWSYNPGQSAWKPDVSQYPKDLQEQYRVRHQGN